MSDIDQIYGEQSHEQGTTLAELLIEGVPLGRDVLGQDLGDRLRAPPSPRGAPLCVPLGAAGSSGGRRQQDAVLAAFGVLGLGCRQAVLTLWLQE